MKKILFLTLLEFENPDDRGIYHDLVKCLREKGMQVCVVCPREKITGLDTELTEYDNLKVLKVKTGNIQKCGLIEKGISTLRIESQYLKAIKQYFKEIKFDMVMYSTPPITFIKAVEFIKNRDKAVSYLILKDIFPQNAVDIELIKKGGFLHKYFRKKEKKLYEISDHIGCMSEANVKYLLEHNPELKKEKIEVFPNCIIPIERRENKKKDTGILNKYNIPGNAVLFVYGGNLGKPQGIDFLLEVADDFHKVENGFLLIVGSGTEYSRIQKHFAETKPKACALYSLLPKQEYDQLVNNADVGLIFLDKRFTIPNFPSRLTAYMENSMPVLAATDTVTDIKDVLLESQSGLWCESGDINSFIENANKLTKDTELRTKMSNSSRKNLEVNYDLRKNIKKIISLVT
ncbi:MAG: glycosyltransferase family 4 protein [Candidatus Delongbacteria bacterium]